MIPRPPAPWIRLRRYRRLNEALRDAEYLQFKGLRVRVYNAQTPENPSPRTDLQPGIEAHPSDADEAAKLMRRKYGPTALSAHYLPISVFNRWTWAGVLIGLGLMLLAASLDSEPIQDDEMGSQSPGPDLQISQPAPAPQHRPNPGQYAQPVVPPYAWKDRIKK